MDRKFGNDWLGLENDIIKNFVKQYSENEGTCEYLYREIIEDYQQGEITYYTFTSGKFIFQVSFGELIDLYYEAIFLSEILDVLELETIWKNEDISWIVENAEYSIDNIKVENNMLMFKLAMYSCWVKLTSRPTTQEDLLEEIKQSIKIHRGEL